MCALVACAAAAPQFQNQQYRPQQQQQQQVRKQSFVSSSSSSGATPTVNIALQRSSPEEPIIIIRQVQDFNPAGSYSFR